MKPFKHINAKTINETVNLSKEYKEKAKLIAGGTDLLGELKDRVLLTYPEALINIKSIPDVDYIIRSFPDNSQCLSYNSTILSRGRPGFLRGPVCFLR